MPTRAPDGAGRYPVSEAGTERICRATKSVPAGSISRAAATRFGSATGTPPSGVFGQSCGPQDSTGKVTARAISAARMRRSSSSGSISRTWSGGCSSSHCRRRARNTGKEPGDHLIKSESGRRRNLRLARSHVHPAAAPKLYPSITLKLTVSSADRVGMQVKTPGQIPGAGQPLPGREIVAEDA
jgi:hypothetical protein